MNCALCFMAMTALCCRKQTKVCVAPPLLTSSCPLPYTVDTTTTTAAAATATTRSLPFKQAKHHNHHPPPPPKPPSLPIRSALSMLRRSSSLLGKVLKISLLGKGLCRNRPHLHTNNSNTAATRTVWGRQNRPSCCPTQLGGSSLRLMLCSAPCYAAAPLRHVTMTNRSLHKHTTTPPAQTHTRAGAYNHPPPPKPGQYAFVGLRKRPPDPPETPPPFAHLILLKLFLSRLGSTSRW